VHDLDSPSLSRMITNTSPSSPLVTLFGSDEEFIMTFNVSVFSKTLSFVKTIVNMNFIVPAGNMMKYGPLK